MSKLNKQLCKIFNSHDVFNSEELADEVEKLFEKHFSPYQSKALKYDNLNNKIAHCYIDEYGNEILEEENIDLTYIGEICASHFGWI